MPVNFNAPGSARRIQQIINCLAESPMTATEISSELGLSTTSIWIYLGHIHKLEPRQIHISGWIKDAGKMPAAIYSAGDSIDKPRPPARPVAELKREHYERVNKKAASAPKSRIVSKFGHEPSNIKPPKAANDPLLAWMLPRDGRAA